MESLKQTAGLQLYNTPPEALNCTQLPQTLWFGLAIIVGNGFTQTHTTLVAEHPFISVPDMV